MSSIIFTLLYSNSENTLKSAEDFPESEGYYDYNNITTAILPDVIEITQTPVTIEKINTTVTNLTKIFFFH